MESELCQQQKYKMHEPGTTAATYWQCGHEIGTDEKKSQTSHDHFPTRLLQSGQNQRLLMFVCPPLYSTTSRAGRFSSVRLTHFQTGSSLPPRTVRPGIMDILSTGMVASEGLNVGNDTIDNSNTNMQSSKRCNNFSKKFLTMQQFLKNHSRVKCYSCVRVSEGLSKASRILYHDWHKKGALFWLKL